ncbi:zinc-binding metallopeptidase family protein [Wenxinia marina]|uniref:Zinc-ribbon domain-containing protein n=1 Tax=Wenxinia marina DSM 24838 TaxID=1123501 RepID=A0A0D0P7G7_9RHOB|nr:putative zinc-binding metallopeptidase [Wenxinia marina]KIQ67531.1 hypothetical protein Wenmar_03956 [Wenxinia marina DSM 24838]GGL68754.1 hypothetical protein GCM10011392_24020 [Wenxinia marina]
MKIFACSECGHALHFENVTCLNCGRAVGYDRHGARMLGLEPDGPVWRRPSAPDEGPWRFCENWERSACNWLVPREEGGLCRACRHNHIIPDLSAPGNLALWKKMEAAKRRLIYGLLRLGIPPELPEEEGPEPLVFDFPADEGGQNAMTGHEDGVVTVALAEADDAEREARRTAMHEPYRTLLGHFRHEVGHYYWDKLIRDGGRLEAFREVFGDERADYGEALKAHYASGAPADWQERHVSAYASSHPWEDWAETWAHLLHIVDALEMAGAWGMSVAGRAMPADPYGRDPVDGLLEAWIPLTVALNGMNRTMGLPDLYPFVLGGAVMDKLRFIAGVIRKARGTP